MPRCFLALGGNLGAVEEIFDSSLQRLHTAPQLSVRRVSGVYRTQPVGAEAGGEFLNAAAEIETTMPPLQLLDLLQSVEEEFGRQRTGHWDPRTLDLDLILYGDEIIDLPRLRVPHPACWYRRFVLSPLVEIAADVVHPEKGVTFVELRARLMLRPLRVCLAGSDSATRLRIRESLRDFGDHVEFVDGCPGTGAATDSDASLVVWLGPTVGADAADTEFVALPLIPRLDISRSGDDAVIALRNVLHAALGC